MKRTAFSIILACTLATTLLALTGCGGATNEPELSPKMAKLVADYPLQECVVSGNKLGSHGTPHNILFEGELIRFCCPPCVKEFNEDQAGYVAKVHEAQTAAAQPK